MSEILSQQARFRVVEIPTALPGHCFTCRISEGPFIDAGFSEENFGAIYFCKGCISEMARTFGWITPDQADAFRKEVNRLLGENTELYRRLVEVEEENHGLRRAVARSVSASDASESDSSSEISDSSDEGSKKAVRKTDSKPKSSID